MQILPYGDSALLLNLEQKIGRSTHARILQIQEALIGAPGIQYIIPAYCSLTVVFDPLTVSGSALQESIVARMAFNKESLNQGSKDSHPIPGTPHLIHEIPVCYDDDFALDIKEVCLQIGKNEEEVINLHLALEYYVYMLGFKPGFAYMGDLPEEFRCQRKLMPRTHVPAGSVAIADRQTAIYPMESPGGWQIIGRTPLKMFDPSRERTAFLQAGDMVRFKQISRSEFDRYT